MKHIGKIIPKQTEGRAQMTSYVDGQKIISDTTYKSHFIALRNTRLVQVQEK